jgi:hypothetical protein
MTSPTKPTHHGEALSHEKMIALLEEHHAFPGPYSFRFIIRPEARAAVIAAATAAVPLARCVDLKDRPSREGRFLTVEIELHLEAAREVLDVYAAVKAVEGVLTSL